MGKGDTFNIVSNRDGVFLVGKGMRLQFSSFRQAQEAQKRLQPVLVDDQPFYVARRGTSKKNRCIQCNKPLPPTGIVLGCRSSCNEPAPDKKLCSQCYARVALCSAACLKQWQAREI